MNFSIYDLVAKLVPGALLYGSGWLFIIKYLENHPISSIKNIPDSVALLIIYFLGNIIDAFAAKTETIFFRNIGGNPIQTLIENGTKGKIKFFDADKLIDVAIKENPKIQKDGKLDFEKLFNHAFKFASDNDRVKAFTQTYYLNRNIFTSYSVSITLLTITYWDTWKLCNLSWLNWFIFIITISILALLWFRTKERNKYFCKEVYTCFLMKKGNA